MMEQGIVEILIDAALKGAALLLVALLLTSLMQRSSAARRHLVWAVSVSALLLIPLLSLVMPAWGVLPTIDRGSAVGFDAGPARAFDRMESATPIEVSEAPVTVQLETNSPVTSRHRESLSATSVILMLWAGGVMMVLLSIGAGFARVAVLRRSARPLPHGGCRDAVVALAQAEGVRVRLLEGAPDAMPMTWGVLRPVLLLPASAHEWAPARLRAVVRHELAHVRRRDAMWQLIGEVACALHWFNPLSWYAARRMRIEREHACDDAVLVSGSRASDYAAELLEIARSMRSARATSMAAIAMARPRQLEGRLLAVLDETRSRGEVAKRWPVWCIAACLVFPLAALEPAARRAEASVPTAPMSRLASSNERPEEPVLHAGAAGSIADVVMQSRQCGDESVRHISVSTNSHDEATRVKWETRNCKGTLEMTGKVRIAGDLSGFTSIPADGKVEIDARDNGRRRQLTLTPAANGFAYVYKVDGDRSAWDADGKAWLSSVLTLLVRRAGFGADERIDHLLSTGGVAAVLTEVSLLESDYTQRLYLNKLLSKTALNGGAVRSVISVAHRELESDYELAEFLVEVARRYDFTPESRAAFIQATTKLESDYEHRRALSAVLMKGGLSSGDVTAVLGSARSIDSDYEKAELLIDVAGRYALDQSMRTAYLNATRNIESDYELRRVLAALLNEEKLSAADAAQVIEASTSLGSDHERGQVLKQVSASFDFADARLQQAYLKAASEIESDHELRQVLNVVLERRRLTPAALDVVLQAAGTIKSDYERSELLVQVLRNHPLTTAQKARVVRITETIGSEHERGRVSALLIRQLNSN